MPYPLKKKVKRETNGFIREAGKNREIIVILEPPNLIGFRAKGCRRVYHLTVEVCYSLAVKCEVAAKRMEKKKAKKRGKKR